MEHDSGSVKIVPGDGVVARIGTGVLCAPGAPTPEQLEPLLEAARATCVGHPAPGRAFVRRVAGHLFQVDPSSVPAFVVMAPAEDGWAVLLHGAVEAVVSGNDVQERLSGVDAATWVDRVVPSGFSALQAGPLGQQAGAPAGMFHLDAGIVPASGVIVMPQSVDAIRPAEGAQVADTEDLTIAQPAVSDPPLATTAPDPRPAPHAPHAPQPGGEVAFRSILLTAVEDVQQRSALPIIGDESSAPVEEPDGPVVDGILCERGHFNHPHALYCSACGVSTVHRTRTLVKGPRPPLGVLVGDDGSAFSLDTDYVVGREPDEHEALRNGEVRPLRLLDAERSVSRVHAEIRLRDWDVVVVDLGSANGTFVAERGETQWRRLAPQRAEVIQPGTRIAFGKRSMTFDTYH